MNPARLPFRHSGLESLTVYDFASVVNWVFWKVTSSQSMKVVESCLTPRSAQRRSARCGKKYFGDLLNGLMVQVPLLGNNPRRRHRFTLNQRHEVGRIHFQPTRGLLGQTTSEGHQFSLCNLQGPIPASRSAHPQADREGRAFAASIALPVTIGLRVGFLSGRPLLGKVIVDPKSTFNFGCLRFPQRFSSPNFQYR